MGQADEPIMDGSRIGIALPQLLHADLVKWVLDRTVELIFDAK